MRMKTLLTTALFAKEGEALAQVALPHTWNALDGQDGGNDYWRGIGTYEIDLPDPTKGKKQYIELQGANHVATVYCNGRELGTHKGGFSTFRYDLTPAMKPSGNVLTVVVSNAPSDIYPQNADFTFYGGLYRDVNYIEVADAHYDLLMDGTDAVFVTPHVSGKTRVDLFPVNADGCTLKVELKDAEGNVVGTATTEASEHAHVLIDVKDVRKWNGLADPYCYTAAASIVSGEEVLDAVTVTYGYRSYHVDPNTGFWLNGKNVPLHGVARHQDRLEGAGPSPRLTMRRMLPSLRSWAPILSVWPTTSTISTSMTCVIRKALSCGQRSPSSPSSSPPMRPTRTPFLR